MLDLFGNHIVGFLMHRLKRSYQLRFYPLLRLANIMVEVPVFRLDNPPNRNKMTNRIPINTRTEKQ